jgi:hypothetical protein
MFRKTFSMTSLGHFNALDFDFLRQAKGLCAFNIYTNQNSDRFEAESAAKAVNTITSVALDSNKDAQSAL